MAESGRLLPLEGDEKAGTTTVPGLPTQARDPFQLLVSHIGAHSDLSESLFTTLVNRIQGVQVED